MGEASKKINCVVTGGGGLLGQSLVNDLVEKGTYNVVFTDLRSVELKGATFIQSDIADQEKIIQICKGADVVFHCCGHLPFGPRGFDVGLHWKVNLEGTKNVLKACLKNGVQKLIYVSTEGVCCDGWSTIKYGNEINLPYAFSVPYAYAQSKIQAEMLVRSAYYDHGLLTAVIRPSFIFGPGDRNVIPGFVKVGQYFCPGNGTNQRDMVYVSNVADAVILCSEALKPGNIICGAAYFISNMEPWPFKLFMSKLMGKFGYPPPPRTINKYLIIIGWGFLEAYVLPILNKFGIYINMPISSNVLGSMTVTQYFNNSKAAKDFGYKPRITLDEGLQKTADSFPQLKKGYNKKQD